MASRQFRKSQAPAPASGSENENSQQSSQDDAGDTMDMMVAAKSMVSKSNERRDKKRKAIEIEHDKRVEDVKVKIDAQFVARKIRACQLRQDVWARLDALDQKRQKIENQILASMKTIETNSINLAGEVVAMFEGRLEDLEGNSSRSK